jgi:hypothetical protein
MADEIEQQLNEEEEEEATASFFTSPECLVDTRKVMSGVGLGERAKADNPSAMSAVLVRKLSAKCHTLRIVFRHATVANLKRRDGATVA